MAIKNPVDFLSTHQTYGHINELIRKNKISVNAKHIEFTQWNDFSSISSFVLPTDLVIIILPRKGGVSYENLQEGIPRLMSKNFVDHNFILIYPSVTDQMNPELMFANDFDSSLIEKGISHITKKAKSLTEVFQKKSV